MGSETDMRAYTYIHVRSSVRGFLDSRTCFRVAMMDRLYFRIMLAWQIVRKQVCERTVSANGGTSQVRVRGGFWAWVCCPVNPLG